MASVVYNFFKHGVMEGSYNLNATGAGKVYVALVTSSYTPDIDVHQYASIIGTGEAGGAGYTTGGLALSSPNIVQSDAGDYGVLTGSNMTWATSTITARGAVLYCSSGSGFASDRLICYIDFGSDYVSSAGNFTITWNAAGILQLT